MRKILLIALSIFMALSVFSPPSAALAASAVSVQIEIDGKLVEQDSSTGFAEIISGRTMVPLRLVAETLGYTVGWEEATGTVTLTTTGLTLTHVVRDTFATDNSGVTTDTGVSSFIDDDTGRTMVSVRLIAEAIGCAVEFEQKDIGRTTYDVVVITTPGFETQDTAVPAEAPENTEKQGQAEVSGPTGVSAPGEMPEPTPVMPSLDAESVYNSMIALKQDYPEGMKWTNDDFYAWNGGTFYGGFGCAGFAFILSDAAFGDLPSRRHTDFTNIRVGDIVRVLNDTHTVIVIAIDSTGITVAEGNYNSAIHWGRTFTFEQMKREANYVMTRYPE